MRDVGRVGSVGGVLAYVRVRAPEGAQAHARNSAKNPSNLSNHSRVSKIKKKISTLREPGRRKGWVTTLPNLEGVGTQGGYSKVSGPSANRTAIAATQRFFSDLRCF